MGPHFLLTTDVFPSASYLVGGLGGGWVGGWVGGRVGGRAGGRDTENGKR